MAASTHVSLTFHFTPGTSVIMCSVDVSGVRRIVSTPTSVGCGAASGMMWPKLSSQRPSSSPVTVTRGGRGQRECAAVADLARQAAEADAEVRVTGGVAALERANGRELHRRRPGAEQILFVAGRQAHVDGGRDAGTVLVVHRVFGPHDDVGEAGGASRSRSPA